MGWEVAAGPLLGSMSFLQWEHYICKVLNSIPAIFAMICGSFESQSNNLLQYMRIIFRRAVRIAVCKRLIEWLAPLVFGTRDHLCFELLSLADSSKSSLSSFLRSVS